MPGTRRPPRLRAPRLQSKRHFGSLLSLGPLCCLGPQPWPTITTCWVCVGYFATNQGSSQARRALGPRQPSGGQPSLPYSARPLWPGVVQLAVFPRAIISAWPWPRFWPRKVSPGGVRKAPLYAKVSRNPKPETPERENEFRETARGLQMMTSDRRKDGSSRRVRGAAGVVAKVLGFGFWGLAPAGANGPPS